MTEQMVASSGVHLSVKSSGHLAGPTVILVHGFPDNQSVWDRIVPLLEPHFHVVTYDVRGSGSSSAPDSRKGYAIGRLIDDLVAVIDRVRPDGAPVHLVGHDWGSIQLWPAVLREGEDARLSGRIASFTSISGPGPEQIGEFFRTSARQFAIGRIVRQLAHSWYIGIFQLPALPEFAFRRLTKRLRAQLIRKQGLGSDAHWSPTLERDGANGVNLYRANRVSFARRTTKVPVHLIVATKDDFVTLPLLDVIPAVAPDLRRTDIVAGHWLIRTHPEVIAELITTFVEGHSA
ncbi:MAG: alpha/beta fold hydrolase [Aeromicrobium sp.]